jgi:hypothetical protein
MRRKIKIEENCDMKTLSSGSVLRPCGAFIPHLARARKEERIEYGDLN